MQLSRIISSKKGENRSTFWNRIFPKTTRMSGERRLIIIEGSIGRDKVSESSEETGIGEW